MTQRKYYEPGLWASDRNDVVGIIDVNDYSSIDEETVVNSASVYFFRDSDLDHTGFVSDKSDIMVAPKELTSWLD